MDISTITGTDLATLGTIFLSTAGIYLTIILMTRLFGKRSFSKMSGFDFAMTIAVGSIVATTSLSNTTHFTEGFFALLSLFLLQFLIGWARKNSRLEAVVDNAPLLLMKNEHILEENMMKARVTIADLRAKLREANVTRLSQVKAVVFETTGDLSVLHGEDPDMVDDWLLEDVKS